ncbi:pectinesterase-like [Telopea speciosissima]|uniref:pectinesterase-like n=1 Tax=Telopea speciosissima TaxID=54955 RepID=UPI001CC4EB34|nr:pectinesterase-like [Telopea speciosissima]
MGKGKAIIAGSSLILVVVVVVGLVVGINRASRSSNNEGSIDVNLLTRVKSVKIVCEATSYKDVCMHTFREVSQNETVYPKDFIKIAVSATLDAVRTAMDKSSVLEKDNKINTFEKKGSFKICKELIQTSIDELQESISVVDENDLKTIVNDRVPDLANWLSAVVFYHETCRDTIGNPELKSTMTNVLHNSTQLTSNALAIIVKFSQILAALNIPLDIVIPKSRRLLEAEEATQVDSQGYPTWLKAPDRKLLAAKGPPTHNAVVAKDGSGQFRTITAALAARPKHNKDRYVIYVKAGIYDEHIIVHQVNVFMYGDGPKKTIVTGNNSVMSLSNTKVKTGIDTQDTASFSAIGTGFIAKSMGFRNTAGSIGEQAVALRVRSDKSAFFNCRIEGYQDTLYAETHRQFYRNCYIYGTVDFIFGDSATLIQNSQIIVRKPSVGNKNIVTAQGRTDRNEPRGVVIQNCSIVPDKKLRPSKFTYLTYLGRPWKDFSTTVIMESSLDDFIQKEGWLDWNGNTTRQNTVYYAEYANSGGGAKTDGRVRWKGFHLIDKREAAQWTAQHFLTNGSSKAYHWLKNTGVPFNIGFTR